MAIESSGSTVIPVTYQRNYLCKQKFEMIIMLLKKEHLHQSDIRQCSRTVEMYKKAVWIRNYDMSVTKWE